ncbi:hypothetical protein Tco_1509144 [Tanacetum coccineum]
MLSDYDYEIRYHPGKANVVADALSREERIKPLRVRALVMTIGFDLPKQILVAQNEARKLKNLEVKDVGGLWCFGILAIWVESGWEEWMSLDCFEVHKVDCLQFNTKKGKHLQELGLAEFISDVNSGQRSSNEDPSTRS